MRTIVLALLLLAARASAGEPPPFQLYPLRGVFYPQESGDSRIDADFRKSLGDAEVAYFAETFGRRFPTAVKTITEATRRRTFAVSLQVARASRFVVRKANGTADLYLPVTASTYFTNVMTGEVLFASTKTVFMTANRMPDQTGAGSETVRKLFADAFRQVVDALIEDADQHFHPTIVSAVARKDWKGLAILEGGREQGISRDDSLLDPLGNELRVISAGPSYAIARVELGALVLGATYSKPTNRTLAEIRKPRVLPVIESAPRGFPEETIVQLFSDALGAAAPISLVPVNQTFAAVLAAMGSQTDLSQERLRQRELPSYFVRLHVEEPIVYETPTNLGHKTLRVTQTLAYAEFVDVSGRVLFVSRGRDRIEDEITDGQALNLEARKEVGVKNALLALAKRIASDLKFENSRLPVTSGGTAFDVTDQHGLLTPGASLRAYKNLGRVDGVTGEVWVPAWDVEVASTSKAGARLVSILPLTDGMEKPAQGDVVILDAVGKDLASRYRFGPCGAAERFGDYALDEVHDLSLNLLHSGYIVPYYSRGLASRVETLVRSGTGFKSDLRVKEPKVDFCVQPIYQIAPQRSKCTDTACADVAQVQLGFRLRRHGPTGEVAAESGLEAMMTATTLLRSASTQARAAALRADLLDEIIKLGPQAARALSDEKF